MLTKGKRRLLQVLAAIVLVPIVALVGLYASCWVNQKKAERLFARVSALRVGETTFEEAQAIWKEFGFQSGQPDDACGPSDCTFNIATWNFMWKFSFDRKMDWKFLRAVGIKPAIASATLTIEKGKLSDMRFELLYQTESGYWVTALVESMQSGPERDPCRFFVLQRHPDYLIMRVHNSGGIFGEGIEVSLAPAPTESAHRIAQAINWKCMTAISACEGFSRDMSLGPRLIMPAAYAEFVSDLEWSEHKTWQDYPQLMKDCRFYPLSKMK